MKDGTDCPSGQPVVELRNVTKDFVEGVRGKRVLDNVSLELRAGSFTAITGPSGAGKSTLLHLIGALDRPTTGSVVVEGRELAGMSDAQLSLLRRRRIGFLFQFFNLLPNLTTWQNIALPLLIDGIAPRTARSEALRLAERVGMERHMETLASTLSGGEMQRAALARALAHNPALVLADEPTGNLDSKSGERVLLLLRELVEKDLRTVVIVTHDKGAAAAAERLIQLVDGKLSSDMKQTRV